MTDLPKPETMLAYASILEKPQYAEKNGVRFPIPTGEIIEAACAALRHCADLAVLPPAGWRDISTAPKDGTRCDVWTVYTDAYQSSGQRYVDAQYREHEAAWFDLYGNKLDWYELDETDNLKPRGRKTTHWMPLPPAPGEK